MAKEFARRRGFCCRLYYACNIVACPFRHAVASNGCTKRRTNFLTGPWLWPLTTLLSSCVGASTGLLGGGRLCGLGINAGTKRGSASARVRVVENSFTGGFVSFLVFAGCAPVCCAQQLCPFSECPFECAHYFFGVPTIFACPLIRPLFSGACPLFSGAHYFFGSALISAQKVRVEAFSVKQKQPIRSRHLLK